MRVVKSIKRKTLDNRSLVQAARDVKRKGEPFVVKSNGSALAAVVPLAQFRLTQAIVRKLEDEEDAAHTRAALADTDPKSWSSLDDIRKELGLENRVPPVRKKSASQAAKRPSRKTSRHG